MLIVPLEFDNLAMTGWVITIASHMAIKLCDWSLGFSESSYIYDS